MHYNMNNQNNFKKLPELSLINKAKVIISKELQSEIMYLHNKVGDIEWSGPVFYKVISGNINVPGELVLKALHIFPYDVGSASYTEYEFGPEILDFYTAHPECDGNGAKWGHMHSHHSMLTFFSGTDMQELHDNADGHNYYLSLIVNHKSQFCAKIATVAERITKSKIETLEEDYLAIKGTSGTGDRINLITNTSTPEGEKREKVLLLIDCEIEFEQDEFFKNRVQEVTSSRRTPTFQGYTGYQGQPYKREKTQWEIDQEAKETFEKTPKNGENGRGLNPRQGRINYDSYDDYYLGYKDPYQEEYNAKEGFKGKGNVVVFDTLEIKSFLGKWIADDFMFEDKISSILKECNDLTRGKKNATDDFVENLDKNLKKYFQYVFSVEPDYIDLDQLATKSIPILKEYVSQYTIVEEIINVLDLYTEVEAETPDFIVNDKEEWKKLNNKLN